MPCSSQIISEMLSEIHTMEKMLHFHTNRSNSFSNNLTLCFRSFQDPDVIAVCHTCGSSSQNRPNCAACGQRFNLYTAYYSKNNTETKKQKLSDTPQTPTQEDDDEDCVVMSTDFPNQTNVKRTPEQLSRRPPARGLIWENVDKTHVNKQGRQRKRRQKTGMYLPGWS